MTEDDGVCLVCGSDATKNLLGTSILICENVVCEVAVTEDLNNVLRSKIQ